MYMLNNSWFFPLQSNAYQKNNKKSRNHSPSTIVPFTSFHIIRERGDSPLRNKYKQAGYYCNA